MFLCQCHSSFIVSCVGVSHIVQYINYPILLFYGFSIAICFSMCNSCLDLSSLIPLVCATQLSGVLVTLGSPSSGVELFPHTWVLPEWGGLSPAVRRSVQVQELRKNLTSFFVTLSQSRRANSSWMSASPLSDLGKSNTNDSLKTGLSVLFLTWVFFLEMRWSLCSR